MTNLRPILLTACLLCLTAPHLRAALAEPGAADAINAAETIARGGPAAAERIVENTGVNRTAELPTMGVREPITPVGLKPAANQTQASLKEPPAAQDSSSARGGESRGDLGLFRLAAGMFIGASVGGALASIGGLGPAIFGALVGYGICAAIAGWKPFDK